VFFYTFLSHFCCQGKHAKFKQYVGHSAHVTNVRWTFNDGQLVSIGGADTSLMIWNHGAPGESRGDSDDSDSDSEEEGGKSSMTDSLFIYFFTLLTHHSCKTHGIFLVTQL